MKDRSARTRRAAIADRAHHDWWQWLAALAPARGGPEPVTIDAQVSGPEGTRARPRRSG